MTHAADVLLHAMKVGTMGCILDALMRGVDRGRLAPWPTARQHHCHVPARGFNRL